MYPYLAGWQDHTRMERSSTCSTGWTLMLPLFHSSWSDVHHSKHNRQQKHFSVRANQYLPLLLKWKIFRSLIHDPMKVLEWKSLTNKKIGMFMPSVSMHKPTAQFGFWNYNERVYMLSTGAGLRGRELTLKNINKYPNNNNNSNNNNNNNNNNNIYRWI